MRKGHAALPRAPFAFHEGERLGVVVFCPSFLWGWGEFLFLVWVFCGFGVR